MREMKDSGIEWIGEIPKHWELVPFKYLLKERTERNFPVKSEERLALSIESGVTTYAEKTTNLDRFKDDVSQYKLAYVNDFVMNSMNMIVGAVDVSKYFGCVSPAYYIFYDNDNGIYCKLCNYLFHSPSLMKKLFSLGKGIMFIDRGEGRVNTCRLKVSKYDLGKILIPTPNKNELAKIIDYLDDKYEKIDRMIAKEQDEIKKLKEYKQSIITETVTKGIRKNTSVKKINAEWIHEIPSSWKISKLKYIFKFGKGLPITKEDLKEEGVPVISYGQVHSKENTGISISNDLIRYVDTEFKDNYPNCIVKKGEFIFADTSEDLDGCCNAIYNNQNDLLLAGYHSIIFKSEFTDNRYFAYLFQTDCWRSQIRCRTTGIKLFSITQKILKEVSICIPPKEEQREIANYLDTKCKKIELMIKEKNKKIDKLKMYQKSLIYECVTGKKEVF